MAEKEALTARMPPDTYGRVEDYREKRDLTKSDAARRLIEEGLDSKTSGPTDEKLSPTDAATAAMLVAVAVSIAGPLAGAGVALAGITGFAAGYYLL